MHLTQLCRFSFTKQNRWKRASFVPYGSTWGQWLPRHMKGKYRWKNLTIIKINYAFFRYSIGRNFANVEHRMHNVNCVLDVIDARLPTSGKNLQFSAGSRAPRVVLFTKTDLTHLTEKEKAYFTKVEMDGGADAVIWGTANNYLSDTIQNDVIDQIKKTVRRWRSNQSVIEVIITGGVQQKSFFYNYHFYISFLRK